ncbi:PepSY domain-containing protein [Bordetella sp. LUAb4]|uniref:PepSY-associated TM helix domain-containing protein n=1 Tax=Bordetella sp. LUAb4 TaxID=2843195 RepID=UPI001E29F6F2|nr:PepSY-associated TM helix domain-containing protein [Bordetella sp. LUAb4]
MVAAKSVKRWYWIHKWSSLICTVFLLVICFTGLPLIFQSEINDAVLPAREAAPARLADAQGVNAQGTNANASAGINAVSAEVSADKWVSAARARFPGDSIRSITFDDDEPVAFVGMVPALPPARDDPKLYHWLKFDTRTAELINTSEQFQQDLGASSASFINSIMGVVRAMHIDWYSGLPGQLFLGFMALLFVAAIVSGTVLYAPFMKKLPFGTVRAERSRRLKWLDLHNLLGIVVLVWTAIVGLTGAINEISGPLYRTWATSDVRAAWAPWKGLTPPSQAEMASVQGALDTTLQALPGMKVRSLIFPNPLLGNDYHYLVMTNGNTPLSERLATAVLIDSKTGQLTKVLDMPWYLRVLELSRPLHFGDYGGLPLKILWALFDAVTIAVLGSGLYLWFARLKNERERMGAASRKSRDASTTHVPAAD